MATLLEEPKIKVATTVRCDLGTCPRSRVARCCQECRPVALCSARCKAWDKAGCGWKITEGEAD